MSTEARTQKKLTSVAIRGRKEAGHPDAGRKIVAVTTYDYTFARLVDDLVDLVLVGDSLGMVIQGRPNTLSVTVDEMVYHSRAVARGLRRAHLVADMPFMSYQPGKEWALRNAGRLLAEGEAEAVKLEGGSEIAPLVKELVSHGVPVLGHVGLTPQSVHAFGGYRVQGKTRDARTKILEDAEAVANAGAYAIVLEGVPLELGRDITSRLAIPTIGIGAGRHCDGQILVMQDLLGLNVDFKPRFVKRFADLGAATREAITRYAAEVDSGAFPDEEHSFS